MSARRAGRIGGTLVLLLALAGCGSSAPAARDHAPTTTTAVPSQDGTAAAVKYTAYAAVLTAPAPVHPAPDAATAPLMTLPVQNQNGAPQTLLIEGEQVVGSPATTWYHVLLPVRPNGSNGWVEASMVKVVGLRYRVEVHLAAFRLDLYDGDKVVQSMPIGVGTDETPTPGGTYYIKELLRPPDQNTIYGHYVFGLSGFSDVLVNWVDGGVLGIHGTNDPEHSLGVKASHGCIRLRNDDIERLARLLPLGTPVTVIT